jgi:alpha-L-rhamnosidase
MDKPGTDEPNPQAPSRVRVEHLADAFGIDVARPRLSWWLPEGAREQLAYRLCTNVWDSDRVDCDQHLLVEYAGPALTSRQRVECTVKVWTDEGESDWSRPAGWEMGLLHRTDWSAHWIEPPEENVPAIGKRPAWYLRQAFEAARMPTRSRLYATAHGIYEIYLNSKRVGDVELTPGYTSYPNILHLQTYDVLSLLRAGANTIDVVLSDGWYRGQTGAFRQSDNYGNRVAFLAQLELEFEDGSRQIIGTGRDWVARTGAILAADLMQGVVIDYRLTALESLHSQRLATWAPVRLAHHDMARLRTSAAPPVRRVEDIAPTSIVALGAQRQIIDMGRNIAGWLRLSDLGPDGTRLRLTYGEALDANGDVTTDNIDSSANAEELSLPEAAKMPDGIGPLQVDEITSAGCENHFESRMSTKGFRYVRVEGHPGTLSGDDVRGVVVHSDLRRTGWFECSNVRLNRLHEAAVRTLQANIIDIPTDCPHRERSGWGSEWQIFIRSAAFLYDVAGFTTKWLRDLAADQKPDGSVFHRAPEDELGRSEAMIPAGSAGYSDAAVIVPWRIYRAYGDVRLLAEQWPSMTAWVDRCDHLARTQRHPDRSSTRPTPAPHEQFLRDTGVHFGEWLAPPSPFDQWNAKLAAGRDDGDFATAYFHYSTTLLARIARILGHSAAAQRYAALAESIRSAWWTEYGNADGTLRRPTQANYARALAFRLAPDALRAQVAQRLVELIRAAKTHVGTGTFGTSVLLPVLADAGYANVAYELLLQDTPPSWLTMIDRGATTIWEMWDGVDENGQAHFSQNHFALGSVISYFHTHIAGIRLDRNSPAYRRFRIAPVPGGDLRWATARLDSPYGPIESEWRIGADDRLELQICVPPGTAADVELPDGRREVAAPGRARFHCDLESIRHRAPAT